MREFERALPIDIAVTGRTLEGIALRWDRPYRVSDNGGATFYLEGWRARAFTRGLTAMGHFHELRMDHRDQRVGRVQFSETTEGLAFVAVADETPVGDAALMKADNQRLRGVSLRYGSDQQEPRKRDGVVWRTRAVARELSLCEHATPQYGDDAVITARRTDDPELLDVDDPRLAVEADDDAMRAASELAELLERSARNAAIDVLGL